MPVDLESALFSQINREGTYTVKYDEAKKKFGTSEVLPLWVADMDLASPQCVQETLQERAKHPIYGYTVYPDGYYDAIGNWMSKRFSWQVKREWIVPCYGVVPSINFAISAYSNEGDGVIVQTPIYPPFVTSVKKKNRKILDNTLVYNEGRYEIDFEDLEAKAKHAKLFLLCSPHNPVGRVWSKEEMSRVIDICLKHNVLIISDEIHADVVYEKVHHVLGSFKDITHHCVILNAPSKTFNIAGLNTSYAIIPDESLRKKFIKEQNASGISNGNPFGIEALMTAYDEGEGWLENLKSHLSSNVNYVKMFLKKNEIPIVSVATEATFLVWLDCKTMDMSQEKLVDFFLYQARLGLNDGMSFGQSGEGFMRLNIGTSKEVLDEALHRLLKAYRSMA